MNLLMILLVVLTLAISCGKSARKNVPPPPQPASAPVAQTSPTAQKSSGEAAVSSTPGDQTMTTEETKGVVVVSGIFDPTGEKLTSLKPTRRYNYRSRTIPEQQTGRFLATVEYTNGTETLVPFDALVADDAGRTFHGFFELTIPLKGEVSSIRITDASGQKQFALIKASEIR